MNLEPVIGLEIHVQLTTNSKMFCSCKNIFGDIEPNSAICPICMGYPGTLPVPNKEAIRSIQKAGVALDCELASESRFDRKSYFYPDLPKGYQISQYDQPFCGKGKLVITVNGKQREIGITRIHLEEDAAKNIHDGTNGHTLVDYNRAGTPLIEIVTEADIKSPQEAGIFLRDLQQIIRAIGVSTADMEKGQMRADANVSMRPVGDTKLYPKTEVKNVNSFKFVEKALQYEIERQTKLWEKGETPTHATRGWDSVNEKTTEQRTKEDAADYRYMPEPDIPPFTFTEEDLQAVRLSIPELPGAKKQRFASEYNMQDQQTALLTEDKHLADFFEDTVSELKQQDNERADVVGQELPILVKLAGNVVLRDIRALQEQEGMQYHDSVWRISPENFAELIILLHNEKISANATGKVLAEMQKTGGDPDAIIKNLGLEQVSGSDDLQKYVDHVISENPDVVEKIKAGKDQAVQFLMGQVMAKSGGKASPKVVIDLLRKTILG